MKLQGACRIGLELLLIERLEKFVVVCHYDNIKKHLFLQYSKHFNKYVHLRKHIRSCEWRIIGW